MKLNDIAETIAVRNLRRRPDRLEHIQKQMEKFGIDYLLFDPVDHRGTRKTAMWWGAQNVLHCIRYAKAAELNNIMFVEDDSLFVDDFNEKFAELWPHMPTDWDIVSFGEIYGHYEEVHPGIVRSTNSWGGHASLIKHTVYDALIETITGTEWSDEEVNKKLKSRINFYAFKPYLITQVPGYSDLVDYHKENDNFQ